MKITDVKTHLLMPMEGHCWFFVQVLTDEDLEFQLRKSGKDA